MEVVISPTKVLLSLWMAWAISWWIAAAWSDRPVKRAGLKRELPYNITTIVGVLLLFGFLHSRRHNLIVWQIGQETRWLLVVLAAIGFGFTWWARLHLGRMWSRWVVRKEHHHIIETGPYALVRHPIYTGISLAILAAAVMFGTVFAYAGAAMMIFSFYIKARLEERFLREEVSAEAYEEYVRRVPMLIPFLRVSNIRRRGHDGSNIQPPVLQKVTTGRFEIERDGQAAYLEYSLGGDILELIHTEVPEKLRHVGLASALAENALQWAREHKLRVDVVCPMVKQFVTTHPEYSDLIMH